jgi:hypothetical protein
MDAENRRGTVAALFGKTPLADESGTISVFGVKLAELPSCLWSTYAEKLMGTCSSAERMLEDAAARFAYDASRVIMESTEFRSAAGLKPADGAGALHSLFALAAAWGWADAEITALQAPEGMTVRARTYAEAEIADMRRMTSPAAYALRGVCRAFMDLAFGGAYPGGFGTYACRQSFGLELGDPYGEFIVTRAGS